jgi:hypothetical protein
MFEGELAKFYKDDGCASYFSYLEQGFEDPLVHYFNSFYFLRVHPNLTGIICCGTHQRVEKVTV